MSTEEHDISWAMKLLEREPEYEMNFLAKHWAHICTPIAAVFVPITMNAWFSRPLWAGFQRHIAFFVAGIGVGHLLTEREKYVIAQRDARLRDYIRLHPEDFPPPERKKYGELFEPWVPVR